MSKFPCADGALSELPPVLTPRQLGELLCKSEDALAQDRFLSKGIPFVKYGSRVYYLRADVAAFFTKHRHTGEPNPPDPTARATRPRRKDTRDTGMVP